MHIPFCQSYIVSNIQDLNCLATFLVCEVESNNQEVLRIVHTVQLQACLHNNITLHHRRAAYLGLYISGKEEKRMHWMLCVWLQLQITLRQATTIEYNIRVHVNDLS